jgi:hypothetical protein
LGDTLTFEEAIFDLIDETCGSGLRGLSEDQLRHLVENRRDKKLNLGKKKENYLLDTPSNQK